MTSRALTGPAVQVLRALAFGKPVYRGSRRDRIIVGGQPFWIDALGQLTSQGWAGAETRKGLVKGKGVCGKRFDSWSITPAGRVEASRRGLSPGSPYRIFVSLTGLVWTQNDICCPAAMDVVVEGVGWVDEDGDVSLRARELAEAEVGDLLQAVGSCRVLHFS